MSKKTRVITQTAIMLALLICVQFITKGFGQFVTGSFVNLILAITSIICGLYGSLVVAFISPIFAFILGIGPAFPQIVVCIAISNMVYVLSIYYGRHIARDKIGIQFISTVFAAFLKFSTIYSSVVILVLPSLGLPDAKFKVMSAMFSWPQLVTALIGGSVSLVLAKPLQKALRK